MTRVSPLPPTPSHHSDTFNSVSHPAPKRVLLSWSSGKDSAWALHLLRSRPDIEVVALVTTFNGLAERVAMHAVRRSLVELQARRAGLPLWSYDLPANCTNAQYEAVMHAVFARARSEDIDAIAFGDLFLEDVRQYRERLIEGSGLQPLFPLWHILTPQLALEMIAAGVRARLTCIDPAKLSPSLVGRDFDPTLLADLPASADPCGENGEFHTFVYASPAFSSTIPVSLGEIVFRDGFVFADLVLSEADLLPGEQP